MLGAAQHHGLGGALAKCCMVLVALVRGVLWCLMMTGHLLSSFMSRQMEFDADRFEAYISGSRSFAETFTALRELGLAQQSAISHLRASWQERRLADDLPALIVAQRAGMPREARAALAKNMSEEQTGRFDSHPAARERINAVAREDQAGIVHIERPASALFRHYDRVCRTLTLVYYNDVIGEQITSANLMSTATLAQHAQQSAQEGELLTGYFGFDPPPDRPLTPTVRPRPDADARALVRELRDLRAKMKAAQPQAVEDVGRYRAVERAILPLVEAEVLIRARVLIDPRRYGLKEADTVAALQARNQLEDQRRMIGAKLAEWERCATRRIVVVLELLHTPAGRKAAPGADALAAEGIRLAELIERIGVYLDTMLAEHMDTLALFTAMRLAVNTTEREIVFAEVLQRARRLGERLRSVRQMLRGEPYPFEHSAGRLSLADFLVKELPLDIDPVGVAVLVQTYHENLGSLYTRCLRRLVAMTLEVEQTLQESAAAARRQQGQGSNS